MLAGLVSAAQPDDVRRLSPWWFAEKGHVQVYSHASEQSIWRLVEQLEKLQSFWAVAGIPGVRGAVMEGRPLRVIEFASPQEFAEFRTHRTSDAYYVGTEAEDFIVLPPSAALSVIAHEYAHFVLHSEGSRVPEWLSEGLAEVFSTIRKTGAGFEFGGELRTRSDTLFRHKRVPLSEFLTTVVPGGVRDSREASDVFYAESWALADMLFSSPAYGQVNRLFATLSLGRSSRQAFDEVYGKSLASVDRDLQDWIARRSSPVHPVLAIARTVQPATPVLLSDREAGMLVSDLLVANREWSRAERKLQELLFKQAGDPKLLTSMGTLALRRGEKSQALGYWRKALDAGASDPVLCYRFALLADELGLPDDDVAIGFEKAIAAKPDFADAHYRLAMLDSHRGNYQAAVTHLRAMGSPSTSRAYSYWSALASCLMELGRSDEAVAAAQQAELSARTPDEHGIASALEYTAKTDFHVQFERGANGQMQAVTIRLPHGTKWNPFIEVGDQIERASGQLLGVQCKAGQLTGFSLATSQGPLVLEVFDPTHVLMRNSPPEFSCGTQKPRTVKVEYAKSNGKRGALLRGMEFQ